VKVATSKQVTSDPIPHSLQLGLWPGAGQAPS